MHDYFKGNFIIIVGTSKDKILENHWDLLVWAIGWNKGNFIGKYMLIPIGKDRGSKSRYMLVLIDYLLGLFRVVWLNNYYLSHLNSNLASDMMSYNSLINMFVMALCLWILLYWRPDLWILKWLHQCVDLYKQLHYNPPTEKKMDFFPLEKMFIVPNPWNVSTNQKKDKEPMEFSSKFLLTEYLSQQTKSIAVRSP